MIGFFQEQQWEFAPHERSPLPGAPATPDHPAARRLLYGLIGVLIAVTGGFGTALIAVNLTYLQGTLGLYQDEISWLPAVYVMTNVPTGMVLIKYRQQFGLRSFTLIFLGLYCLLAFAHLFSSGFWAAVAVRAASGIAGSALTTLSLNYFVQALPAARRLGAITLGLSVPQLAFPIARLFSVELLGFDQWRTLYLFEFGLSLVSLALIGLVRLPPATREQAFEWLDLPTVILFTLFVGLISAVLAQGRYEWWMDSAWIGWALAASIPLFGAVFLLEYHRANPMIDMRWLGRAYFIRLLLVGTMARIVLSEQTYGTVGLLYALGYTNDQLFLFSALTVVAAIAGIIVGALAVGPDRLSQPVAFAIGLVAVAAFIDSHATNLTRPPQLYVTQMVIAFSTTMYIGPAILVGLTQVIADGGKKLTSFIILFATTQSLGGLIGTALLSTYQSYAEKQHSFDIVEHLTMTDPQVALAIQQGAARYSPMLSDPALRTAEGAAALSQRVAIEANVLAYNDVFRLIAIMAAGTTVFLMLVVHQRHRIARRQARMALAGLSS
ncbi:MFS transporter [Sphingobium amiense]|uniref:MFS transporter n=1 Tax=Sphingobium amiense TaxID=135719 RepID=A0A494W985_9SPHN|nr:MFS transporter [Sphingobium amiense]BBD96985.1 MFS transporter [Sphingobium amiense]